MLDEASCLFFDFKKAVEKIGTLSLIEFVNMCNSWAFMWHIVNYSIKHIRERNLNRWGKIWVRAW
jgi:hypothetical protein